MKRYKDNIKRGDVFYANLNPVLGSEQGGIRPVLIIQNNIGNKYSPTLIVCAITGRTEKNSIPTHVSIDESYINLKNSFALLEQIRTIDRLRLKERVGSLSSYDMEKVDKALSISLGLYIA